jgi:hypothetical protein
VIEAAFNAARGVDHASGPCTEPSPLIGMIAKFTIRGK